MTKREINKLDKLFREVINERDAGRCQFCGNPGNNVHHLVGRRNRSTRWLPSNGLLLCPGCHTFRTNSFHQDPMGTMDWFKKNHPDRYVEVMGIKNKILKQTYENVIESLDKID